MSISITENRITAIANFLGSSHIDLIRKALCGSNDTQPSEAGVSEENVTNPELFRGLVAATNVETCLFVYAEAQSGSQLERLAIIRALNFANSPEQCKEVFQIIGSSSNESILCIQILNQLLSLQEA